MKFCCPFLFSEATVAVKDCLMFVILAAKISIIPVGVPDESLACGVFCGVSYFGVTSLI